MSRPKPEPCLICRTPRPRAALRRRQHKVPANFDNWDGCLAPITGRTLVYWVCRSDTACVDAIRIQDVDKALSVE